MTATIRPLQCSLANALSAGQFREPSRRHFHATQYVVLVGVEAGRYQDQIGHELLRGQQFIANDSFVMFVTKSGLQWHIYRETNARTYTTFRNRARVRIEVILVDVEEENGGIVVEDGLRSIAMVDIPVDDQDSLELVPPLGVTCRDRNMVK